MKNLFIFVALTVLLTTSFVSITANVNSTINRKSPVQFEISKPCDGDLFFEDSSGLFLFMVNTQFRNYLNANVPIVLFGRDNDCLRTVAFFMILKCKHKHGYFYSYNSARHGFKQTTFDKYLNRCTELGWVVKYKNSFRLTASKKLNCNSDLPIYSSYKLNFHPTIAQVYEELRTLLLRLKNKNQVFASNEQIEKNILSSAPKMGNVISTDCFDHKCKYNIAIGYKALGRELNRSATTAYRKVSRLVKDGTLTKKKAPIERIATGVSREQFDVMVKENTHYSHLAFDSGKVFEHYPNIYSFTSSYSYNYSQEPPTTDIDAQNVISKSGDVNDWEEFTTQNFQWD
jgi:hypothetical protein